MAEREDVTCPHCKVAVLASRDAEGVVYMGGVSVVATVVTCPACHESVSISQFRGISLEFGSMAIEEIARSLALIGMNGGFGSLIVKFQKGRARWIGLAETLRDVCQ